MQVGLAIVNLSIVFALEISDKSWVSLWQWETFFPLQTHKTPELLALATSS